MSVSIQAKFPLFSTSVGNRIAWLRGQQGLTLSELGDGKPTTAQSWEKGKQPGRDKWQGISERIGLSEIFIFHGRPESEQDYAFIAKYRNLIAGAEQVLADKPARLPLHYDRLKTGDKGHAVSEPRAGTIEGVASRIPQHRAPSTRRDCEVYVQQLFNVAELSEDPNAWPVLLHRLQRQFPLDEWETTEPKKE